MYVTPGLFFGHFSEFSLGGQSRNIEFFDFFREFLKNYAEFCQNSVSSLQKILSFRSFFVKLFLEYEQFSNLWNICRRKSLVLV